jgi:hypothetical protein
MALVSTLVDDFEDGTLGSQWAVGNLFSATSLGASATISESGGKQHFALTAGSYNASKGIVSVSAYDWTGTGAYFQLPSIPNTSAYCAIMFTARVDTSVLGVYVATNGLNIGIGDTGFGDRAAVSYNSATMGWLRLAYSSSNARWEGYYAPPSENPPSTWTLFGSFNDADVPSATQAKNGKCSLEVLAYGTVPTTAEYFAIESVNTASASATGSGSIIYAADPLLTFTHSATLTGGASGAIAGSTVLAFGGSGGLLGVLSGTSSLAFAHGATLTGPSPLSGTATLTFANTALGSSYGTSAFSFALTGTLTAPGWVPITPTPGLWTST